MTSPPATQPRNHGGAPGAAIPVREISAFVLAAFALAWAVHVPILLSGNGPDDPSYGLAATVYMFTSGVVAIAVTLLLWRPRRFARALGLIPLRPLRRLGGYSLLAFVLLALLGLVATLVAALVRAVRLDLVNFSGLRELRCTPAAWAASSGWAFWWRRPPCRS
ncbi:MULTISPECIES: hypothetical protein [unclassified Nocardiopsis]|uniref:hypothetical protein n=1 Tax=Nocardiopsis TaxID=2013 RepID=UPI00387B8AF8